MAIGQDIKKTVYYLKRNGLKKTVRTVQEKLGGSKDEEYRFEPVSDEELSAQAREVALLGEENCPKISIVVPMYCTKKEFVADLMDSVLGQSYPYFELILADATPDESVKQIVDAYTDSRIVYRRLEKNENISGNTNAALQFVAGEYVGLLDHDDVLTKDALFWVVKAIRRVKATGKAAMLLYSDEDKWTGEPGDYYDYHQKEDFNKDLLYTNNYICHFCVMDTGLMQSLQFRSAYDGAQDFDLVLRATDRILSNKRQAIVHIPRVLYHWRCHKDSTAANPFSKMYAYEAGRLAVEDLLREKGIQATVAHSDHVGFYEVSYENSIFAQRPEVGLVGGKIIKKGCLAGGRMDRRGKVYYEGLKAAFGGYLHRAVLAQSAEAVDIRAVRVNPAYKELFEEVLHMPYREDANGWFDASSIHDEGYAQELSLRICEVFRNRELEIVWDPKMIRKL